MNYRLSFIAFLIFMSSITVFGQTTTPESKASPCPKIEIIGPPAVIQPGETMKFRIEIENPEKFEFAWTVNKGSIISGQDSTEIVVGETEDLSGSVIEAKVKIKGIPSECPDSLLSETGVVSVLICCGSPLDEFGRLADDDVRGRIDNLMIRLQADPHAAGHLISYGLPDEVSVLHNLIRRHLEFRKYDSSRVVLEYRGYEERISTRVWLVPEGADTACID